jgi:Putative Flp pilus-assembly TadE/G-like
MARRRTCGWGSRGQVITLYTLALPVLLGIVALAFDGGKMFVSKLHTQNAADAAALASAQEIGPCLDGSCAGTPTETDTRTRIELFINQYSTQNRGPTVITTVGGPTGDPTDQCAQPWYVESTTQRVQDGMNNDGTCYTWPYVKASAGGDPNCLPESGGGYACWDQVEVRIREPVSLNFARLLGLGSTKHAFARGIGAASPALLVTTYPGLTTPGTTIPGQTHTTTTPGGTHTTTTPDSTVTNTTTSSTFVGGTGSVAFVKSTDCRTDPATATVPAGAAMQWSGATSSLSQMIINGGIDIAGTPTKTSDHIWLGKKGVPNCNSIVGSAKIGTITGPFAPLDWPVPPPPAPPGGCLSTGTNTITAAWKPSHGPGIYCWTGTLTVSANSTVFSGYSFYAPQLQVNSNSMTVTNAPGNPPTVFYAYGPDKTDPTTGLDACSLSNASACALAFNGGSNTINGDIFVPSGTIAVAGGGAIAGTGFMESLKLLVSGNFAGYNGTGPGDGGSIVTSTSTTTTTIPGSTQTTTDPETTVTTTDPDVTVTGSTSPGSTATATTSTNIGLDG